MLRVFSAGSDFNANNQEHSLLPPGINASISIDVVDNGWVVSIVAPEMTPEDLDQQQAQSEMLGQIFGAMAGPADDAESAAFQSMGESLRKQLSAQQKDQVRARSYVFTDLEQVLAFLKQKLDYRPS